MDEEKFYEHKHRQRLKSVKPTDRTDADPGGVFVWPCCVDCGKSSTDWGEAFIMLEEEVTQLESIMEKSSIYLQQCRLSHYDMDQLDLSDAMYDLRLDLEDAIAEQICTR